MHVIRQANPEDAPSAAGRYHVIYIRYMDMIQNFQKQKVHVRVSDLSDVLNIPRPGVTRTIKEMEKKGLVQKTASPDDGRVTYLSLTEHGKEISEKYNENYFNELTPYLDDISDADADCMVQTIQKFYDIMCERSTQK